MCNAYPLLVKLADAVSILLAITENVDNDLRTRLENTTAVYRNALTAQSFLDIGGRRTRRKASHFNDVRASKTLDGHTGSGRGMLVRACSGRCACECCSSLARVAIVVAVAVAVVAVAIAVPIRDDIDLGSGSFSRIRLRGEQGICNALSVTLSPRVGSGACGGGYGAAASRT